MDVLEAEATSGFPYLAFNTLTHKTSFSRINFMIVLQVTHNLYISYLNLHASFAKSLLFLTAHPFHTISSPLASGVGFSHGVSQVLSGTAPFTNFLRYGRLPRCWFVGMSGCVSRNLTV